MPIHLSHVALLALLLAIAGCASSPAPSPATSVDDARAITEQRPTPERDQINHLSQLTEQGYTGNTSRLSGHFEMAAADGRYAVHDTYLLGDRDTPQIAKQHLMERLKRQALDQAGVYRAFEERLSADQQLAATSVLVSGSVVALHDVRETVRPVGEDRLEMTLTATAIVDSSGLQRHIDALYDIDLLPSLSLRCRLTTERKGIPWLLPSRFLLRSPLPLVIAPQVLHTLHRLNLPQAPR